MSEQVKKSAGVVRDDGEGDVEGRLQGVRGERWRKKHMRGW